MNYPIELPPISRIEKDNDHGTGWALFEFAEIDKTTWEYEHGMTHYAVYRSTGGTCHNEPNDPIRIKNDEWDKKWAEEEGYEYVPHHHGYCNTPGKHKWECSYFYYPKDNYWELGSN